MRDRRYTSGSQALTWLVSLLAAVYFVQFLMRVSGFGLGLEDVLGASSAAVRAGHVWTLVTYGFLHSTANLLQAVGYVVAIAFLGREVIPVTGTRRFLGLFLGSLAAGGLAWAAVHWRDGSVLIGASAAVTSLLVVFACFFPEREVSLLVFFILPVSFKPRHGVVALALIDAVGLVVYEILHKPFPFYLAHSAHLGGMAAGWFYYRYFHDARWAAGSPAALAPSAWIATKKGLVSAEIPAAEGAGLKAEVDRILDKISSQGMASLTQEERQVLDQARNKMGRH